jgi:hypothetical protein
MSDDTKKRLGPDELSSAHAVITTLDFARANIERYLQIHTAHPVPVKMRGLIYKIADEANAGIEKLVDDSAALAAKTLQAFIESRRKS